MTDEKKPVRYEYDGRDISDSLGQVYDNLDLVDALNEDAQRVFDLEVEVAAIDRRHRELLVTIFAGAMRIAGHDPANALMQGQEFVDALQAQAEEVLGDE